MPDQNNLLKAIRVIVREEIQEEVQPIKNDISNIKEDVRELNKGMGKMEERMDNLEQKVDNLPTQMIEIISSPLIEEDEYQDKRLNRLEKHNKLPPFPRSE